MVDLDIREKIELYVGLGYSEICVCRRDQSVPGIDVLESEVFLDSLL